MSSRLLEWKQGLLLFDPNVEFARTQIDRLQNQLVVPRHNPTLLVEWTKASVKISDAIIIKLIST